VSTRQLSVAFVLPYGETRDGFFPDTFLGTLCTVARNAGHQGEVVRVYYNGHDASKDRQVAKQLDQWLEDRDVDLVVAERLFDAAPIRNHVSRLDGRACVVVSRGESFDPIPGVDLAIGVVPSATRGGRTKRSPTLAEVAAAFEGMLSRMAAGEDPAAATGVSRIQQGRLTAGTPLSSELAEGYQVPLPATDQHVIVLGPAPRIIRKTVFGNSGCPYAGDPGENPHYDGVVLEEGASLARLGCAFCCMGGDYQKRPDDEVVAGIISQAVHLTKADPNIEELVLSDQYPIRYLASLVERAQEAGLRSLRWLFAARCDAFVKEAVRLRSAVAVAARTGHVLEIYLSGFESFCDADLQRYNKGITVTDQLAAISAMRALADEFPGAFEYKRARGHSLILWNPWTSPEDLRESIQVMRQNGLAELFHDIGRNRLRLYNELPITRAAERDGALVEAWEERDEGTSRQKGYNPERPWRFLDPRMRNAHELAKGLRDRLGSTTELSQLAAVANHCAEMDPTALTPATILAAVDALNQDIADACDPNRTAPAHGWQGRGQVVLFAAGCNNDCSACTNRNRWYADSREALFQRVDAARSKGGAILLAGREPTLHADFLDIVGRARGDDGRVVGLVTNGRRFSYAAFTKAALGAGLRAVSLKVFGATAETADAYSRDPGGFEQGLAGAKQLLKTGLPALEVRVVLHHGLLAEVERLPELVSNLGASQLRVEVDLNAIGLGRAEALRPALKQLQSQCNALNLPMEMSPLPAGTNRFEWLPPPRRATP
jgi:pyruvate-formate lyase-activating enzyme